MWESTGTVLPRRVRRESDGSTLRTEPNGTMRQEAREKRKMTDRERSSVALSSAQKARKEAERTIEEQEKREKIAKKVAKELFGKETFPWEGEPSETSEWWAEARSKTLAAKKENYQCELSDILIPDMWHNFALCINSCRKLLVQVFMCVPFPTWKMKARCF